MFDKPQAPAAPDYSPIAGIAQQSSATSAQHSQDQLDWAKNQYATDQGVNHQIVDADLQSQHDNLANSEATTKNYNDTYVPLQNKFVQEAQDYASPSRIDQQMGAAQAGVAQNFDAARQSSQRDLESYGINPASTRYAALDIGTRSQQAAAEAAAGTKASVDTTNTGLQLKQQAIANGMQLPGQAAGQSNAAQGAGTAAANTQLATTQSGANTMGTGTQWSGLGNSALGVWGNTLNQQYQNQANSFKQNQDTSSGMGAILGQVAGIGLKAAMLAKGGAVEPLQQQEYGKDETPPFVDHHFYVLHKIDESGHRMTDDEAVHRFLHTGDHIGTFASPEHAAAHMQQYEKHADGGAVGDGGAVPTGASPTAGKAVDDVPAKLTAGEFVMPKDVVSWHGEKALYAMIAKAHEQRAEAKQSTGAVPTIGSAPAQKPTFVSRPAVG